MISLTFKVISFSFLCAISASETLFTKKIYKKKRISLHISFDFFGQKPPIISAKRLPQTAKKGAKKKLFFVFFFLKSEAPVVGYFGEKTCEIFVSAKNVQKKVCTF